MFIKADEEGKRLLLKLADVATKHDILGGEAIAPIVNRMKQCLMQADEATKKEKEERAE